MDKKTVRAAFQASLPVMAGYIVLGMGFGVLLADQGYHLDLGAFHVRYHLCRLHATMPRWI